jgi:hypothetical protein
VLKIKGERERGGERGVPFDMTILSYTDQTTSIVFEASIEKFLFSFSKFH